MQSAGEKHKHDIPLRLLQPITVCLFSVCLLTYCLSIRASILHVRCVRIKGPTRSKRESNGVKALFLNLLHLPPADLKMTSTS